MSSTSTPITCSHCKVVNPPDAHYCAHCGKPLVREYTIIEQADLEYLRQSNKALRHENAYLQKQVNHFLPNRIKHWWSNHRALGWVLVVSSILALGFAVFLTLKPGIFDGSVPVVVGSSNRLKGAYKTKIDSVSYLMGLYFGSVWQENDLGDLRWKRVAKGITDYFNSKGSPNISGFNDQLEISLDLAEDVFDSYLSDRSKGIKASRTKRDSVAYLIGVGFGHYLKEEHIGALDNQIMGKGVKDFLSAQGDPADTLVFYAQFKVNACESTSVLDSYLAERKSRIAQENMEKETAFMADNRGKQDVVELPSGLQYTILDAGNARKKPRKNTDIVYVKYTGTLLDGSVFEETINQDTGDRFPLLRVSKSWQEGLKLIGEGGRIRLFVPAQLAYGNDWNGTIEPNSTLIFDIQLLKVTYGR